MKATSHVHGKVNSQNVSVNGDEKTRMEHGLVERGPFTGPHGHLIWPHQTISFGTTSRIKRISPLPHNEPLMNCEQGLLQLLPWLKSDTWDALRQDTTRNISAPQKYNGWCTYNHSTDLWKWKIHLEKCAILCALLHIHSCVHFEIRLFKMRSVQKELPEHT
jgi:hypothetical protein